MIVHSALCYLTEIGAFTWRPDDWTANKIIHAVKGDLINGYFEVTIAGKKRRFDKSTADTFLPILYNAVADKMAATIEGDFVIVPIPSSTAVVGSAEEFGTLAAARMMAKRIGARAEAVPALRWKEEKVSARRGGSRDPQQHFANLRVTSNPARQIVLYDDVMTSGSQMTAAYRRLAKDASAPTAGFVIGRTVHFQRDNVFGWSEEDLPIGDQPINLDELFGRLV